MELESKWKVAIFLLSLVALMLMVLEALLFHNFMVLRDDIITLDNNNAIIKQHVQDLEKNMPDVILQVPFSTEPQHMEFKTQVN